MGAIVVGVVGAGLAAPPRHSGHSSENLTITLVLLGLGLASLLPYVLRAVRRLLAGGDHDDRRRPGVRLERGRDEARLGRSRQPAICSLAALWALVDRGRVRASACSAR